MVVDATATLKIGQVFALLGIVVGGMLLAGLVVILGRNVLSAGAGSGGQAGSPASSGQAPASGDQAGSLIRSWIAIALVLGLLVFCAASLWLSDDAIRSTLFGGLIASVGAAVAFYFSSQGADKARSDILQTAVALSQPPVAPTAFSAAAPPAGNVNTAYPSYKFAANGLPAPTFSVASGSLPKGLDLALDGSLTGTPTEAGSSSFTVRAMNVAGHVDSPTITIGVT
jgi:hypothetical protein